MKNILFTGAATALITPFTADGQLDTDGLEQLIEFQIQNGISALVIAGTTGEGSTLSFEEFSLLIAKANAFIRGRVPLIAGTGSNNTATAIKLSLEAEKRGADGLLIVTPYYNKTTQTGLIDHYSAIADRVHLPITLYNVPSRTGMQIECSTLQKLAEHPNIIAIKEASGNISAATEMAAHCPNIALYSGNDDQIVPLLALGGKGVISVLSNILPWEVQNICNLTEQGNWKKAAEEQLRLLPLIKALFRTVNPIGIKYAASIMNLPGGDPRLPLIPCDQETKEQIRAALKKTNS